MNVPRAVLLAMLSVGFFVASPAANAQPALEQFRLDPPRLCLRDAFRWGFSYRGFSGGLAAVKHLEVSGRWDGPGELSIRSLLTPTRDDLQRHAADEGRFESYLLHWSPPRKPPGEIRYTLRAVLADGHEVTTATSVRYEDGCAPPARYTTLAAGPTGRIGFQTATPTTSEFLKGVRPPATHLIWGDLQLPSGPVERSPAVVLVHGSGGVSVREDRWAEVLRQAGAATFLLDSFTGRGIAFTAEDQSQLSSLAMIGDTYRALELLATHPRIDPGRIAVMGFSKGGAVALYSALTRFQRLHGQAEVRFAQHIAFYAPCYITYIGDDAVTDRPIRLFHGMADDLAPIERCRAYVERLRRAGADAELTSYPGAHHQFDRPGDGPVRHNPREQNASRCVWEERTEGQLVNSDTGQPFSLDDACVSRGGSFGPDPAAYRAALQAVKALVGATP
jgi:dienelactone hydrolase